MTLEQLTTAPWSEIPGRELSAATSEWRLKLVSLTDSIFAAAVVAERRDDISTRQVITDPPKRDQVRAQGFA